MQSTPKSPENLEKKTQRALLVQEYAFNNELVIRDSGCCVNKRKRLVRGFPVS